MLTDHRLGGRCGRVGTILPRTALGPGLAAAALRDAVPPSPGVTVNIMAKLGEYQGVKFTVSRSRRQEEDEIVSSVVERPNNPPTNVDWVISDPDSNPKISDVIAAGTSFRLTQRSDYASYLAHNSVDALINALQQQAAQNS